MIAFLLVIALPAGSWWLGSVLAANGRQRPRTEVALLLGFVALPALIAWLERPLAEKLIAASLALIAWGSALLAHDSMVLVAAGLVGAVWALWIEVSRAGDRATASVEKGASLSAPAALRRPATRPPANESNDEGYAFRVELRCPTCGAGIPVPVYHRAAHCDYCGSTHAVERSAGPIVTVIPDAVGSLADVSRAVVGHFRHLHYLTRYDQVVRPLVEQQEERQSSGDAPIVLDAPSLAVINAAEARVERDADAYAAKIAPLVAVTRWEPFLAPYWHASGTLYQAAFGRDAEGEKRMELAVTMLESSLPASDAALPEMGKLSYLRALRPLEGAVEAERPALPVERPKTELDERLGHLSERRVDLPISVLARRATFIPEVEALVYRPWHVATGTLGDKPFAFLVDGGAGAVVGPPPDALPPASRVSATTSGAARLAPHRCPACGADLPFAPDAVAQLCLNCFHLVSSEGERRHAIGYLREEAPRPGLQMPFWRFPFRLRTGNGDLILDLPHLTDGIDGTLDQIGSTPPRPSTLFVPAFRTRVPKVGVRLYRRLWPLIEGWDHGLVAERFAINTSNAVETIDVTLPAEEARVFGRIFLALAFTRRDLARAEQRRVRECFLDCEIEGASELCFIAVPAELLEPLRHAFGRALPEAVARLEGT